MYEMSMETAQFETVQITLTHSYNILTILLGTVSINLPNLISIGRKCSINLDSRKIIRITIVNPDIMLMSFELVFSISLVIIIRISGLGKR